MHKALIFFRKFDFQSSGFRLANNVAMIFRNLRLSQEKNGVA